MDKSTVVYDVRPLLGPFVGRMAGVKTGVGEYAAQLLAALRQEERWRLVLFSNSLRAPSSSLQSFNIEIVHTRYPNRLLDLAAR